MRRATTAGLVLWMAAGVGLAGPQDTRVGETRTVYARAGTTLRAEAAILGAPVGILPQGTSVSVLEVKLPWVRVRGAAPGAAPIEGWMRAFEAVEPSALAGAAPPVAASGTGGVSAKEVSSASRQFTGETERRFRASRADLARGYALVDEMERTTAAISPYDALDFVMEGELGRRGRDYRLPGRLPPDPERRGRGKGKGGPAPGLGQLGGFLKKVGVKEADKLAEIAEIAEGVNELFGQMNKQFTAQQEYFLGRAVAAQAFARYGVDPSANRRRYVKRIGDALVRLADPRVPPNFGGYHFDVLDSPEINGVSGPGGFVLVTRGAVEACKTEDELAGILAHELAHVVDKHGERMIRQSESFQNHLKALGGLAKLAGLTDERVTQQLVQVFTSAVGEAFEKSASHAYGQDLEFAADQGGTYLLYEVLYDWNALKDVLAGMSHAGHAHGGATHAPPASRAAALGPALAPLGAYVARPGVKEARAARFALNSR